MPAKKKETVPNITFLHGAFRIQHDGDNYILETHCSCRRRPDYAGTKREWLGTGATGRTVEVIKRQLANLYDPPFHTIVAEALTDALEQFDLAIPESPTKRKPVAAETPAA